MVHRKFLFCLKSNIVPLEFTLCVLSPKLFIVVIGRIIEGNPHEYLMKILLMQDFLPVEINILLL